MTAIETWQYLQQEGLIHHDMAGDAELFVSDIDPTRWVRFWPSRKLVCYGSWPPVPARIGEVTHYLMTGFLPWMA